MPAFSVSIRYLGRRGGTCLVIQGLTVVANRSDQYGRCWAVGRNGLKLYALACICRMLCPRSRQLLKKQMILMISIGTTVWEDSTCQQLVLANGNSAAAPIWFAVLLTSTVTGTSQARTASGLTLTAIAYGGLSAVKCDTALSEAGGRSAATWNVPMRVSPLQPCSTLTTL